MEKNTKDFSLFRLRSTGAIISDGYQLYMDNFRKIFRTTWLMAVVYALVIGVFSTLWLNILAEMTLLFTVHAPMESIKDSAIAHALPLAGGFVVITLAMLLLTAFGFSILRQHREENSISIPTRWFGQCHVKTAGRTLTAGLIIVIALLFMFAFIDTTAILLKGHLSKTALGLLLVGETGVFALLLPMLFLTMTQYIMMKGNWHQALRYWGSAIIISLVVCIVIGLLSIVTELPAAVLFFANITSMSGTLLGDPSGMPDYMSWLNIIVFTLAGFIQAYIYLSALFPFYYLYGSVETQEKERAEMNKKLD